MRTLADALREDADAVEKALEEWLPARPGDAARTLGEAMRYASLGGGKRLRGHLVLTFCTLYGGERRAALPYAAAVEMMHAFSLVHDDLPAMDNDEYRRGGASRPAMRRSANRSPCSRGTRLRCARCIPRRATRSAGKRKTCSR